MTKEEAIESMVNLGGKPVPDMNGIWCINNHHMVLMETDDGNFEWDEL
jgi:hypothetical protein